jgi:hypothetical protein
MGQVLGARRASGRHAKHQQTNKLSQATSGETTPSIANFFI